LTKLVETMREHLEILEAEIVRQGLEIEDLKKGRISLCEPGDSEEYHWTNFSAKRCPICKQLIRPDRIHTCWAFKPYETICNDDRWWW